MAETEWLFEDCMVMDTAWKEDPAQKKSEKKSRSAKSRRPAVKITFFSAGGAQTPSGTSREKLWDLARIFAFCKEIEPGFLWETGLIDPVSTSTIQRTHATH